MSRAGRSILILVATGALAASVAAHGSIMPPPPPEGPPGRPSVPNRPAPPPRPPENPSTSPRPAAPVAYDPLKPKTTPGSSPLVDLSAWTWWWELNKEPFLDLKRHVEDAGPQSTGDGLFLGRGTSDPARTRLAPRAERVEAEVVPAMVKALEGSRSNELLSATLIAVGRLGDDLEPAARGDLADAIVPHLRGAAQEIPEAALVALGVLGHEPTSFLLADVLHEREAGKKALGGGRVGVRKRAFAAYALGLLGRQSEREDVRRYVVHQLASALAVEDGATADVAVACELALGIVPLAPEGRSIVVPRRVEGPVSASRETQVETLLARVVDERAHRQVRAHGAIALGRLASEADAPEVLRQQVLLALLEVVGKRTKAPVELRRSIVIAFGRLVGGHSLVADAEARERLAELSRDDADAAVRQLALLSLGRAGGRAGAEDEVREETRRALLRALSRGKSTLRRWAGLGLALLERGAAEDGEVPSRESLAALRRVLDDARSTIDVGAYAIGVGIARDGAGQPFLERSFERVSDDRASGHVALGLGLVGAYASGPTIRGRLEKATYRPDLLRDAAAALALIGDKETVDDLVERLARSDSVAAQAALARALGRIGDARAVTPLLTLLGRRTATDRARAFAAAALGIVCDRDRLPWSTPYAVDSNYTAAPLTLLDDAGNGLLNLL